MTQEIEKKDCTQASQAQTLIEKAIAAGANIEQLERLYELKVRDEANEAKKAYVKAMAEFKANQPKILKDKKVGFTAGGQNVGYKHASLGNICESINKELSKHGLSASWQTNQAEKLISVTCKITHNQGHCEETTLTANADTSGSKNSIQAIGSTVTYLQRYTLLALTGLATYDDDDGNAACTDNITEEQANHLADLLLDAGCDIERFCKFFGIDDIKMLPAKDLDDAKKTIALSKKNINRKVINDYCK